MRIASPLLLFALSCDLPSISLKRLQGTDTQPHSVENSGAEVPASKLVSAVRYPQDNGQVADILVTINGGSNPKIYTVADQVNQWRIDARALNFPYRKMVIYRVEAHPQLNSMVITTDLTDQGELRFVSNVNDPQAGSIRVLVRDMSACEDRYKSATMCIDYSSEINSVDFAQVFTWKSELIVATERREFPNPQLGAGIGRLGDLLESDSKSTAFGGMLAKVGASLVADVAGFSAGTSYALGFATEPWSKIDGFLGKYPGYGFAGLSFGNIYGGFYDQSGSGFGSPVHESYTFDPNGWVTGITNNSYYTGEKGVVASSKDDSPVVDDQATLFGSSAFYIGHGAKITLGRQYNYLQISRSDSQGRFGEEHPWLAH